MRQIIKKPIISEKSFAAGNLNKFCFWVDKHADKETIAKVVGEMYKVDVIKVNTSNSIGKTKSTRGKLGKRGDFKKATLTLKHGQKVTIFEAETDEKKPKEKKREAKDEKIITSKEVESTNKKEKKSTK